MSLDQTQLAAGVKTPQMKEEPEEQRVKQEEEELPVTDPDVIAVIVKSEEDNEEESSLLQQTPYEVSTSADDGAEESHQFPVCNKRFWTKELLETHGRRHMGEKPLTKVNHLDSYVKTHQGAIIFNCSVCQVDFSDLSVFTRHLITLKDRTFCCSGSSPFEQTQSETEEKPCGVLNKEISETPQMKEEPEERSVKQEEEQLAVSVPESSASPLQHKQTEHKMQRGTEEHALDIYETCSTEIGAQGKRQKCPFCKKPYYSRQGLKRHMKVHTGDMPYSCSHCQKTFFQKYTYDAHMRMHTGELTCSACAKSFAYKETYQAHLRTHKGECYNCTDCGKSFAYNQSYQVHLRTHTGECYNCIDCGKSFAYNKSYQVHLRTHKRERYSCTDCGKSFAYDKNYQVHLRTHAVESDSQRCGTERPFSCSLCHRTFKKRAHLDSHFKVHRERDPAAAQPQTGLVLVIVTPDEADEPVNTPTAEH